jgi:hypothetical protein
MKMLAAWQEGIQFSESEEVENCLYVFSALFKYVL